MAGAADKVADRAEVAGKVADSISACTFRYAPCVLP